MGFYKILSGKHSKDGVIYIKGDTLELTDKEAETLKHKVSPVAESSSVVVARKAPDSTTEAQATDSKSKASLVDWDDKLSVLNNLDAIELIKAQTSEEELDSAFEAEKEGRNRKTVLDAIEAAKRQLL